ncbi:MAG TPA: hypothetical protein VL242_38210 [Sorangium sp.]|nr:hypothetical protein [Sorangium sp.]
MSTTPTLRDDWLQSSPNVVNITTIEAAHASSDLGAAPRGNISMNTARKYLSLRQDRTHRSRCHAIAVLCLALSFQAIVVLGAGCTLTSDGEIGRAQSASTDLCPPLSDAPVEAAPYDDTVFGTVPAYSAPIPGDEEGPHGTPSVTPPATAHTAVISHALKGSTSSCSFTREDLARVNWQRLSSPTGVSLVQFCQP